MDHLLRETPKKVHINLRRSYFARAPDRNDTFDVGNGIEAMKGVYQSLRTAEARLTPTNNDSITEYLNRETSLLSMLMCQTHVFGIKTGFVQLAYQLSNETDRTRFFSAAQMRDGREPPLWQMLRRFG